MFFFDTSCQKPKGQNFANPHKHKNWIGKLEDPFQSPQTNSNKNNPEIRGVNNNYWSQLPIKSGVTKKRSNNQGKRWEITESPPSESIGSQKLNKSKSFNAALKKVWEEYKPKADKVSIKEIKKTDLKEFRESGGSVHLINLHKQYPTLKNTPAQSTLSRGEHKETQNYKNTNFGSTNIVRSDYYSNQSYNSPISMAYHNSPGSMTNHNSPSSMTNHNSPGSMGNQNSSPVSINFRQNKASLKEFSGFDSRKTLGNKQHVQYMRKMIRYESQNQNSNDDPFLQKNASETLLRNTMGGLSSNINVLRNEWQENSSMKTSNSGSHSNIQDYSFSNNFKKEKGQEVVNSVRSAGEVNHAMQYYVPAQPQNRIIKVSSATRIPTIKFTTSQPPKLQEAMSLRTMPMSSKALESPYKVKSMENIPEQDNQEKQDLQSANKANFSNLEKFSKRFFKIIDGIQKQQPKIQMNMNMNIHFQQQSPNKGLLAHPKLDFAGSKELLHGSGNSGGSRRNSNSPIIQLQRTNSYTSFNTSGNHEKQNGKKQFLESQKLQLVSSEEFGTSQNIQSKVLPFPKIKVFQQKYKGVKFTSEKLQKHEVTIVDSSSLEKTVQKRSKRLSANYQTKVQKFRPFNSPKSKNNQNLDEKNKRYSESSVQQLQQTFGQSSPRILLSPVPMKKMNSNSKSKKLDNLMLPTPLTPKMTESQIDKNDDSQSQKSSGSIVLYNAKMLNLSPNKNHLRPEKIVEFAYKKFDQMISVNKIQEDLKNEESPLKQQKGKLGSTGIQDKNLQQIDQVAIDKRGSHMVPKYNQKESIIQPCEQWSPSKLQNMNKAETQKAQMLKRNPNSKLWKINVVESVIDSGMELFAKKNRKAF